MPWWALALRLTGIGWYIAACIILGVGLGLILDRFFNTQILFLLVGVVLGSFGAGYGVYRMVLPLVKEVDRDLKID